MKYDETWFLKKILGPKILPSLVLLLINHLQLSSPILTFAVQKNNHVCNPFGIPPMTIHVRNPQCFWSSMGSKSLKDTKNIRIY